MTHMPQVSSLGTNRLIHGSRMNAAPVGANDVAGPYLGGLNEENFHFLRKAEAFALAKRRGGPSRAGDQRFLLRSAPLRRIRIFVSCSLLLRSFSPPAHELRKDGSWHYARMPYLKKTSPLFVYSLD